MCLQKEDKHLYTKCMQVINGIKYVDSYKIAIYRQLQRHIIGSSSYQHMKMFNINNSTDLQRGNSILWVALFAPLLTVWTPTSANSQP